MERKSFFTGCVDLNIQRCSMKAKMALEIEIHHPYVLVDSIGPTARPMDTVSECVPILQKRGYGGVLPSMITGHIPEQIIPGCEELIQVFAGTNAEDPRFSVDGTDNRQCQRNLESRALSKRPKF